jgi:hypothetical protein
MGHQVVDGVAVLGVPAVAAVASYEHAYALKRAHAGSAGLLHVGKLVDIGPYPNPTKAADGKRLHALAPDPATEHVVRRIFADYLAGRGLKAIAEGLTRDDIPGPSGPISARSMTTPRCSGRNLETPVARMRCLVVAALAVRFALERFCPLVLRRPLVLKVPGCVGG